MTDVTVTDLRNRVQSALRGRYELKRELGRGGMAIVFLAHDLKHHRQVAIKVFQPELAGTVGHERFLREIQVAANLTHPHILALYDSGEADELLYYVMPYVQGETLRERLRRGPFELNEAIRLAVEIADALSYAHRQGLVHRDIKPENVMLSNGHALVMDFGICRAVDEASSEDGLTRAGLTLGTPAYMSPEQWTNPERVGERSDLYSLGCVLYEMLVGEPPFTGSTAAVMLARHTQQEMPSVRVVRPDVPEAVEAVLRRALAKLPDARYGSATEFGEALGSAVTLPSIAVPARPSRSRRIALFAGISLVVLAAGYGLYAALSGGVGRPSGQATRLVVLPFENLAAPDREYFADGLTEEITSRLAGLTGLAVIARTTTMQYKGTSKTAKQIGRELGVEYVVEGSVRCGCPPGVQPGKEDSLLVRASLIRVDDEETVWNDTYKRRLGDLFSLHSDIPHKVGEALQLALLEPDRERLAAKPTDNLAAYDFYLRGNSYYYRSWERNDVQNALAMYQKATELDPRYAAAWARVGHTHTWMHRLRYDPTENRLKLAKEAIDRALKLDDDLLEAHITLGIYYYWARWDYARAMDELLLARRQSPNNEEVIRFIGHIRRRQGQWEEAIKAYEEAVKLDPQSHLAWFNLAEAYGFVRKFPEARRRHDKALVLAPEFLDGYLELASLAVRERGDAAEARRLIEQTAKRIPPDKWRPSGFFGGGIARVAFADAPDFVLRVTPGVYGMDSASYHLVRAEVYDRMNQRSLARAQYDSARVLLERRLAAINKEYEGTVGPIHYDPGQSGTLASLAIAYAGLGRTTEAVEHSKRAAELFSRDEYDGPDLVVALARVYMMVGNRDAAISQLELVLGIPSRVTTLSIKADPIWRPLWGEPGFQRLVGEMPEVTALRERPKSGELPRHSRS